MSGSRSEWNDTTESEIERKNFSPQEALSIERKVYQQNLLNQ